jgi:phosphoribosylaminoimidazolecarboxamide formyltransferase/IMP cyclohydrolase
MASPRLAVLASGSGTLLQAVLDAGLPVCVVLADRPCRALDVARRSGVQAELLERKSFGPNFDREAYTALLVDALRRHQADVVAMAGFGTVLGRAMFEAFGGRILNTHPALLPAFKGWHAVRDALAAGVTVTGTTVHLATEEVDGGPVLAQEEVPVLPGDTEEALHERIKVVERRLYPATIREFLARLTKEPQMKAVLSVYDKTGLEEFARTLVEAGYELVASGNTAAALAGAGIAHQSVEQLTGSPEMLGGRVKTLHPRVHAGILADLSDPSHQADLQREGVEPVGVVACNLYPFFERPSVETVDIGGVTLLRAAAKNFARVTVVCDPADYGAVAGALKNSGQVGEEMRLRLARKAFAHTAAYDAAIVAWLDGQLGGRELPPTLHLSLELAEPLRYGENPHQLGARYRRTGWPSWWDSVVQHQGIPLSYLNIYDADAAWGLVHALSDLGPAVCVIVKHANPCGAAVGQSLLEAYEKAFDADPVSSFGGIVALSGAVDGDLADAMAKNAQADVVMAPSFSDGALSRLAAKRKATRVLAAPAPGGEPWHVRQVSGGWLVQSPYGFSTRAEDWKVVTSAQPSEQGWADLVLAWRICAAVKSNAIALAKDGAALGIGAGQQNRVAPGELAVAKAAGRAKGGAAASDAFFPFRDGLDTVAAAGVSCVVQPGGSVRDAEVIAAAEEHGIAMVFTGERQFRH